MDKVSFSLDDAKIKIVERSRGRMKIQIKLSKEEAEGFKNFCNLKPPEMADDMFYKQIFFAGCNTMTKQIQDMVEEYQKSQAEEGQDEQTEEQLQDK